jgi:REP element-mobilizing transposase RayT
MPHSHSDILVHVIFSTKERRAAIADAFKERLFAYMSAIVKERGGVAHLVNGTNDHVHMLISVPTSMSTADMMRFVKGSSSRWVHREIPGTRGFGWQTAYSVFSVSRSVFKQVHRYIARQEEHHRKASFKEEMIAFLRKHEIEYDDKYLWL